MLMHLCRKSEKLGDGLIAQEPTVFLALHAASGPTTSTHFGCWFTLSTLVISSHLLLSLTRELTHIRTIMSWNPSPRDAAETEHRLLAITQRYFNNFRLPFSTEGLTLRGQLTYPSPWFISLIQGRDSWYPLDCDDSDDDSPTYPSLGPSNRPWSPTSRFDAPDRFGEPIEPILENCALELVAEYFSRMPRQ
jgi:hypothetical protein